MTESEIPTPLYPERQIIFGNGLRAQLIHSDASEQDEQGTPQRTFWFRPLEYLAWHYKLEAKDYTSPTYGWIKRSYPKEACHLINESPLTTTWLLTKTFDGKEGINFDRLNREMQINLNQTLLENRLLRKYLARLNHQITDMVDMPDAYRSKVLSELKVMMDTVMTKESNKEQEQGQMMENE